MSRLELDGLTRAYGSVTAPDHLSFSVASGQVTGFLGPNGAGKTTAMRAVFGLTDLDAGAVRWNGADVTMSDRRRFGYLPEERGLYPGMLAGEQLEYLGRLHGLSPAAAATAAAGWLDRLGVADRAGSKIESLSLGNQQRVQLASALVHNPDLLVFDEPLSGLDPAGIDAVGEVLASEARAGKCVLFSSHQLDLVEDLCESVVIIDRGRVVTSGTVDELTTTGRPRLVVRVAGDRDGAWARTLGGVTVSENDGGALRLVLAATGGADAQSVLRAAMAAGPVTEFAVRGRRLSEVFREAVSQRAGRAAGYDRGRGPRGGGVPVSAVSQVIPIVIVVLAVAFMIVRLSRRGGARITPAVDPAGLRLLPLPGDIGLVAARELRARVRGRAFRTGTLLVLLVVAGAIVIPALLNHQADVQRIGVAWPLSGPVRAAVLADGPATGTHVELVAEPSGQAAAADLRGGRTDLAVVDGREVVVAKATSAAGTSATAQLTQAVARTVGTGQALRAAGLTPAQAAAIAGARPLPVSSLEPGGLGAARRNATFIGLLLVVFMLTQYNAWTLTGVLEEKSSRIVEVLLAAITPARLLAGKVLGIGLAAFVQAGAAVATAVALAKATHSDALAGITPATVASTLAWLILGYAFYSWVYAAAGSTVSRQEQAQSLLLPLGLPVIFGYLMATTAITSGNPSAFFHVLGYLPPTAPFVMPVLVSLGAASWWQVALSAAVSVACTAGVARAAIAVYRTSILRTGSRVPLRELLTR